MTTSAFDTIIHIGAATGAAVPDWLAAGATRVILVEPNPAHHPALSNLAATCPQVEVIEAAIADRDGEGLLHVFNLARHSSLTRATGLTELLPGLRQVRLLPVPTLTPTTLFDRLAPLTGAVGLLLDAPGLEGAILQHMRDSHTLDVLAWVEMICTEEPQYEGAASRQDLQTMLEDAGFALIKTDLADPDWPRLSFRIDRQARQIATLTEQVRHLTTAAASHSQEIAASHAAQAALMHDLATAQAAVRDLDRGLAEALAALALSAQEIAALRHALEVAQSETAIARGRTDRLQAQHMTDRNAPGVAPNDAVSALAASQTIARQSERIKDLEMRQNLAREELRRYEGQMDLIKDLLLRGDRL